MGEMKQIKLTKGKSAIVDDEDFEYLNQWKWHYLETGYAARHGDNKKYVLMHREIMKPESGMIVDHIDHNTLDNRRDNLRLCTRSQNLENSKIRCDNTSGHKGVSWNKRLRKWHAYIFKDRRIHLGFFDSIDKAIDAYQRAETQYFGEFAYKIH